jgi:hypothetical protein
MLTDEQKSKAVELKTEVATAAGRAAVVELKKEVQRGGATARELAAVVGVHESTLCRWEREVRAAARPKRREREGSSQGRSSFRMVRVAARDPRAAPGVPVSTPTAGGLRVAHAPSGLVVDGLDVASLAELMRRLS